MKKLIVMFALVGVACGGSSRGPEEPEASTEQKVDKAAKDVEEAAEGAAEDVGEAVESAGDEVKKSTEDED